jgi:hypothetical protein
LDITSNFRTAIIFAIVELLKVIHTKFLEMEIISLRFKSSINKQSSAYCLLHAALSFGSFVNPEDGRGNVD